MTVVVPATPAAGGGGSARWCRFDLMVWLPWGICGAGGDGQAIRGPPEQAHEVATLLKWDQQKSIPFDGTVASPTPDVAWLKPTDLDRPTNG